MSVAPGKWRAYGGHKVKQVENDRTAIQNLTAERDNLHPTIKSLHSQLYFVTMQRPMPMYWRRLPTRLVLSWSKGLPMPPQNSASTTPSLLLRRIICAWRCKGLGDGARDPGTTRPATCLADCGSIAWLVLMRHTDRTRTRA